MRKYLFRVSLLSVLLLSVCSAVIAQPNIVMTSVNANVNDEVVIDVNLAGLIGQSYSSLTYWAYYDSTKLEFLGYDFSSSILPSNRIQSSQNFNESSSLGFLNGPIKKLSFGFFDANGSTSQGNLAKLRFRVKAPGTAQITRYYYALGDNAMNSTGGIITTNTPPTAVSITTPANNASLSLSGLPTQTLSFNWPAAVDPDPQTLNYTIQLATVSNFSSIAFAKVNAGTFSNITYKTIDSLLVTLGTNVGQVRSIYARILSSDGDVNTVGAVSTFNFTRGIVNTPPVAGMIVTPTTSVVIEGSKDDILPISWTRATDADGDNLNYEWQLALDAGFSSVILNATTSDSTVSYTFEAVHTLLGNNGIVQGGSVNLFHRVIAIENKSSNAASDTTDVITTNFTRGSLNQAPVFGSISSPTANESILLTGLPTTTKDFSWTVATDAESDALTYKMQISLTANFTTVVDSTIFISGTSTTRTFAQLAALFTGNSTAAFMRVVVTDGAQNDTSSVRNFTLSRGVLNFPPVAGSITLPTENQVVTFNGPPSSALTVTWDAATDVDMNTLTYTHQLSKSNNFTPIEISTNANSATNVAISFESLNAILSSSLPEVLYHRVIVSDGITTDTTSAATFVGIKGVINTPPVAAEITSPANNTVVSISGSPSSLVTPTWTVGTDADNNDLSYTWQLSNTSSFATVGLSVSTDSTFAEATFQQIFDLLTDAVSVWNHRVITSDGFTSDTSATRTVIFQRGVLNTAPTAAVITSPSNGTSLTVEGEPTNELVVVWDASTDAENDDIAYTWQLSTTDNFDSDDIIVASQSQDSTSIAYSFAVLAAVLDANNVAPNSSITLYHRVVATDGVSTVNGASALVNFTRGRLTSIEGENLPVETALAQNYPNPFNPSTTINYTLAESGMVRLSVYDLSGRMITNLVNDRQSAGNFTVNFDAANLPSGVYMYRLEAGSFTQIRKMTLLK
jgi:hypothetical protein